MSIKNCAKAERHTDVVVSKTIKFSAEMTRKIQNKQKTQTREPVNFVFSLDKHKGDHTLYVDWDWDYGEAPYYKTEQQFFLRGYVDGYEICEVDDAGMRVTKSIKPKYQHNDIVAIEGQEQSLLKMLHPRIEQLHKISEADVKAEGFETVKDFMEAFFSFYPEAVFDEWVWVYSFVVTQTED